MANLLGSRIKEIRETKGIDQLSLSSAIGCARPAVSNYESGKRSVPTEKIKVIAAHLEVDPLDLLELRIKDQISETISTFKRAK
nr:hypothetical protein CKG001_10070 [Bdellovibrio sp. CKG001]